MKEVLEISDVDSLLRLANFASVIIRKDPFLVVPIYGQLFLLDLGKLDKDDVRRALVSLREKIVNVRSVRRVPSLSELLERESLPDWDKGNP